jgi:hypothetical protein
MITKNKIQHFEVWKVIFHGVGTEAENYGFKRHWKIVDKIETGEIETAFDSVLKNLTDYGYVVSSSVCPVVTAKFEKEKEETFVVSLAGKEYNWNDWDETIAPNIAIRKIDKIDRSKKSDGAKKTK